MDAVLLRRVKERLAGGLIIEIVIWQLPVPVPGSAHRFKYRLFFGRRGQRIVGYDNERGKGDHRHVEGRELPYVFRDPASLETDFFRDVAEWRQKS